MLSHPLRHIPGPWYTRYTHLWLKFRVIRGERVHYIHALHADYGPMVRIAPSEVAVASVSGFREVHRIGSKYTKSPWYEAIVPSPDPILFSMSDARKHTARRKLFAHGFSAAALRKNWETVVSQKAEAAIANIRREAEHGTTDVLKWFVLMATDVIAHLSFGQSLEMLETGEVYTLHKARHIANRC